MARQPRVLIGQVVAITGAARGIGRTTAQALAREGARVAIGDLDGDLARTAAEEIGGDTRGYELNVTDKASFNRFLEAVESELGPVDVLINNAGIMPLGRFVEEDDATAIRQFDINVHGVIYGMKLVLPGMLARGRGHIVNVASAVGRVPFPGGATYSASKHAVVGLSESVRAELRGTPIEISCVMPVAVNTELGAGLRTSRLVPKIEPDDVAEEIVEVLKLPRFDVWVPRSTGRTNALTQALPRRLREGVARLLGVDKVAMQHDSGSRVAYEARVRASEPGLEPGKAAEPAKASQVAKTAEPEQPTSADGKSEVLEPAP